MYAVLYIASVDLHSTPFSVHYSP